MHDVTGTSITFFVHPAASGPLNQSNILVSDAHNCTSSTSGKVDVTVDVPTITGTFNICVGTTTQLHGSVPPASPVAWESASSGVASIDGSTGWVTAHSQGTSIITYTEIIASCTCRRSG